MYPNLNYNFDNIMIAQNYLNVYILGLQFVYLQKNKRDNSSMNERLVYGWQKISVYT